VRAQTSLPALGMALLVLATTAGLGLAVADGAFADAERSPTERRAAVALSERLVAPETALTARANVVNATAAAALTDSRLRARYPVVGDRDVRIRLDGRTLVRSGTPDSGTTIRRVVLVRAEQVRAYEPEFRVGNATTVPRRTDRVRLAVDPPPRTAVRAVRANDRVVLRNSSGLRGNHTVDVSRFETVRLRFAANRSLSAGDVRVTYYPARERKAVLEVTVDGA